jgi:hypothetical protein
MLAPYLHSKNATKPVAPDPVFFEYEVHPPWPEPTTIVQINSNIWYFHQLKITGQLPIDRADNLINDQRILGNNIIDHDKLVAARGDPTVEQKIIIEGGLPTLPGCEGVIMPLQLNGHTLELEASKDPALHGPQSHPGPESKPE